MPTDFLCPGCGAELTSRSTNAWCSQCQPGSSPAGAPPEVSGGRGIPEAIRYLGDYELLQEIARGGMGIVFRARQGSLGRLVALKVVAAGQLATAGMIDQFHREAESVSRLDHRNIVQVFEVGEDEGNHYFSMRLVPGPSLAELLSRGRHGDPEAQFSPQQAANLVLKIARAIQHAHSRNVHHRDLKPGNILMDEGTEPVLVDFGLAQIRDPQASDSIHGAIMGTAGYMAPEQASGAPGKTAAVDIYGLGAVLYELLTGRPPFVSANPSETLRQVLESEPTRPRQLNGSVDQDLETICLKCLEKSPVRRYASAGALAEDLERWLARMPIYARPIGRLERGRRWCRRNPILAAFAGTICLALVVTTSLLIRIEAQNAKLEEIAQELEERAEQNDALIAISLGVAKESLAELWSDRDRLRYDLSADRVAVLSSQLPKSNRGKPEPLRLTMGLLIEDSPLTRIAKRHSMLDQLEEALESQLRKPVRIGIRLFKFTSDLDADLRAGRIDFARMGALRYLRSKKNPPSFLPLAIPVPLRAKEGVFFTRNDSGIRTLPDIVGHRLALGETNSTIGFCAKIRLAEAGIRLSDLAQLEYLDSNLEFSEDAEELGFEEANRRHEYLFSHRAVVEAVLNGEFDVGVTTPRALFLDQSGTLVAIENSRFVSSETLLVARPDMPEELRRLITEDFLRFSGEWMQRLTERPLRFEAVTPETFAAEESWLDRIDETFPRSVSLKNP